jgi:superfamily I DNA and RNA helicase
MIVLPDAYRAKSRAPRLMNELARLGIDSHLVGVTTSQDEVFQPGSVALAHIHRAKGNEAPMVYAVDSQHATGDFNAVTRRNTLFTAITRSRAWVRVTGWGDRMDAISSEVAAVFGRDFKLEFTVPTPERLAELRHIHRDRTAQEAASVKKARDGLAAFLEAYEKGAIDITDLPPAVRTRLILGLQSDANGDDS